MSEPLFQEARTAQRAGDAERAEALYARLLAAEPAHFRALHNMGLLREDAGRHEEAEAYYARALEAAPGEAPPRFNLGCLRHMRGDLDSAERLYREAVERDPNLTGAHFNLGRLLQERGEQLAAEEALRTAARQDGSNPAHHRGLADSLLSQRRLIEALASYVQVADLAPEDAKSHHDLGKVLEHLSQGEQALLCYRRALELEPRSDGTREACVRVLSFLDRREEALEMLEQWRAEEPGRGYADHLIASLGGAPPAERAPDAYVSGLFDRFASNFDAQLERLEYRGPELVRDALALCLGEPSPSRAMLDAGCGTGLCAPLIRPWARTLEGVDLSAGMLERARRRGGYDTLVQGELISHLLAHPDTYDVVVSADTFIYLGPLEQVSRAAHAALRPGGWLVFTLERGDGEETALADHGRYLHSEAHARAALAGAGFAPVAVASATLRRELGVPVEGLVVSALRP